MPAVATLSGRQSFIFRLVGLEEGVGGGGRERFVNNKNM